MVERRSNYHVSFKAIPPSGLLGNMAPFLNTDVTNPRELYSMLSETKRGKALLASVSVTQAKLPPLDKLQSSSEVNFRPLKEQTKFSSYPDLVSFSTQQSQAASQDPMRRSTSLQNINQGDAMEGLFHAKKLKPILRGSETNRTDPNPHNSNNNNHEKVSGVKFGQKEVRLIKDAPLPPIEGGAGNSLQDPPSNSASVGGSTSHSPQPHHRSRHQGTERPPEIFPRGQPVKVEKPVTPTYEDYPEAYWELRSPTVGEPSDLKEDMIDRDRYRLQQISSLRLRAVNRELVANRLDSYRKWQQQIHEHSQALMGQGTGSNSSMAKHRAFYGPFVSPRSGVAVQQPRVPLPVRNHSLAVSAKSINPNTNPATLKRSKSQSAKNVEDSEAIGDEADAEVVVAVDLNETRRQERINAAAKAAGAKGGGDQENGVKPVKASVVNLCMGSDRGVSTASDVYNGVRKITFGIARPQSDKGRTQFYAQGQHSSQSQRQGLNTAQINAIPGSTSAVSHNATLGSSHSQRQLGQPRVPSAPNQSNLGVEDLEEHGQCTHDLDRLYHSNPGSKLLLKKFNRLQVFGENSTGILSDDLAPQWDLIPAKAAVEKHPYLPQNRPQIYKLDTRRYPGTRHGSAGRDLAEEASKEVVDGTGYPIPSGVGVGERGGGGGGGGGAGEKSEAATSLSFRFRNGEVIVSRQGKKPNFT